MTQLNNLITSLTEALLQELLEMVSTLQIDISELKKADKMTSKNISRKQLHKSEQSSIHKSFALVRMTPASSLTRMADGNPQCKTSNTAE